MDSPGSVTQAIPLLRSPDTRARADAARLIWGHYIDRLLGLARGHLTPRVRRREDEEDVLQSAFRSFCRRQERGDFDLNGRDELWGLLVKITVCKARNTANRHRCAARDYQREQDASPGRDGDGADRALEWVEAGGPPPPEAAALDEEFRRRLDSLGDDTLRRVALLRMDGYSIAEIAAEIGQVPRSVERKIHRIKDRWSGTRGDPPEPGGAGPIAG